MGSKNKLRRFRENETFGNVLQPTREEAVAGTFNLKGKWNSDFFKNDNPEPTSIAWPKLYGTNSVSLSNAQNSLIILLNFSHYYHPRDLNSIADFFC